MRALYAFDLDYLERVAQNHRIFLRKAVHGSPLPLLRQADPLSLRWLLGLDFLYEKEDVRVPFLYTSEVSWDRGMARTLGTVPDFRASGLGHQGSVLDVLLSKGDFAEATLMLGMLKKRSPSTVALHSDDVAALRATLLGSTSPRQCHFSLGVFTRRAWQALLRSTEALDAGLPEECFRAFAYAMDYAGVTALWRLLETTDLRPIAGETIFSMELDSETSEALSGRATEAKKREWLMGTNNDWQEWADLSVRNVWPACSSTLRFLDWFLGQSRLLLSPDHRRLLGHQTFMARRWVVRFRLMPEVVAFVQANGMDLRQRPETGRSVEDEEGEAWDVIPEPFAGFDAAMRDSGAGAFETLTLVRFWHEAAVASRERMAALTTGALARMLPPELWLSIEESSSSDTFTSRAAWRKAVRRVSDGAEGSETEAFAAFFTAMLL